MIVEATAIEAVKLVTPRLFEDARGWFFESYNRRVLLAAGIDAEFVQDNQSRSARGVVRGLHYQVRQAQGKLVRCVAGAIFDVAVDLRRSSPDFGRSVACELRADTRQALWVPAGFAHGFLALADDTEVLYKTTDYWAPEHERCVRWNDPALSIPWPLDGTPVLNGKDAEAPLLADAETYP